MRRQHSFARLLSAEHMRTNAAARRGVRAEQQHQSWRSRLAAVGCALLYAAALAWGGVVIFFYGCVPETKWESRLEAVPPCAVATASLAAMLVITGLATTARPSTGRPILPLGAAIAISAAMCTPTVLTAGLFALFAVGDPYFLYSGAQFLIQHPWSLLAPAALAQALVTAVRRGSPPGRTFGIALLASGAPTAALIWSVFLTRSP